jgi:hypothetical protein
MWSEGTQVATGARTRRVAASALAAAREQHVQRVRQATNRVVSGRTVMVSKLRPQVSRFHPSSIRRKVPKPS